MNNKLKKTLIAMLGLFVGVITIFAYVQTASFPEYIHLSPGQQLSLSVHYPLSFYEQKQHQSRRKLVVRSAASTHYTIQLRVFGAIPIKNLQVRVEEPVMVVPGGQAVGVLYSSQGVVIVGHVPLRGSDSKQYYPARDAGLKIGDILTAIDGISVNTVDEVEFILKNFTNEKKGLSLTILRHGQICRLFIKPVLTMRASEERFMLGIMIEDPAAGVGTLSFYDPVSRKFAGLGHRISDFAGKREIPFQSGEIVLANITGLRMGTPGHPGEKIGLFNINLNPIGKISRNCDFGIYGTLYDTFPIGPGRQIPVAFNSEVKEGPAQIYTVIKGTKVQCFGVTILKVYSQERPRAKGLVIKVTDPKLLRLTGGIIQGMSGSPIVQDGKLIGAITHVFVNDPTKGYGILAEWMIGEMNKKMIPKAS